MRHSTASPAGCYPARMRWLLLGIAIAAAILVGIAYRGLKPAPPAAAERVPPRPDRRATTVPGPVTRPVPRASGPALSPAEKAIRLERIRRDYDEIRAKASAEYAAAGAAFPGGLNAFLRQLALLERENRADLAALLTPEELEDLELRETTAGQRTARLLGGTEATEEQRRAVFRLQHGFEDEFALTFDVSPAALLERERARQATLAGIREVLGDETFAAWARGESADYDTFQAFAVQQGLPGDTALRLWHVRNEFTLRRLEIATQALPPAQLQAAQAALAQQIESRVMAIVGAGAMTSARAQILQWLPQR